MATIVVLLAVGCGSNVAVDEPRTCGGTEPVRLLEDSAVAMGTYSGDRLLVYSSAVFPFEVTAAQVLTVGSCGEQPTRLEDVRLDAPLNHSSAGTHVVRVNVRGDVFWVDPLGVRPEHLLFEEVVSCLLPIAGGLATQTSDGALIYHADPSDPMQQPAVLVEGALQPTYPNIPSFDKPGCSGSDTQRPVADGDGVLVAEADGPLVRVAVPSGEREVLVAEPVGEFVVLDDPRYVLWGGSCPPGGGPSCGVNVLDRQTGDSTVVSTGELTFDVQWSGLWLEEVNWSGPEDYVTDFHSVASGERIRVPGRWDLQAVLSQDKLLVFNADAGGAHRLDTRSRALQPVDFPSLPWPPRDYDDGVVALSKAHPDDVRGDLLRMPFGSVVAQVQARGVPPNWQRTHSGNLLFIDREDELQLGTLVLVDIHGERRELATDVSGFGIPHHGTTDERNEVLYSVAQGDARGLWRFVLP